MSEDIKNSFDPGAALTHLWRTIPKEARFAFMASFFTGLLVYGFALTNVLVCVGDSLNNIISSSNQSWLGRWSCEALSALSSNYSLPFINGIFMIIAISFLSAFVALFLRLTSKPILLFSSLVLICYPSVGNTLKYTYMADGYMFAALLAVIAVWLTDKYRHGWVAGIPLLVVSLGTYQAYLSLVIALMLVNGIQLLIKQSMSNRKLGALIFRYALLVIGSVVLYYGMTRIINKLFGITLSAYQSVNSMSSLSASTLLSNFARSYTDFWEQLQWLSYRDGYIVSGLPNYIFLGSVLLLVFIQYYTGKPKTVLQGVLLCILIALSPMLLMSIRIFNPATVHALMTYSAAGFYLLGLVMVDHASTIHIQVRWLHYTQIIASWLIILCIVVCLLVWIVGINIDFFNGKLDFTNMFAQASAFLTFAESTPGYEEGMPIYVIGSSSSSPVTSRITPQLYRPKYFYSFMRYFLAVDMPFTTANDVDKAAAEIAGSDTFASMPSYPLPASAQVINDAMVIKLSD